MYRKKKLKDCGIKLISILEQLDDSPESIILESVLEGMAEYYSKNLAREVMKGMKENALQCKHTGGIPPLGYNVNNDKKYEINESEAVIVRKIFDLYLNGHVTNTIANKLNELGFNGKTGKPFKPANLRDILANEKYSGTYFFNKRISGKKHNRMYKDESEIIRIENGMPVIIEKEVFEMVQRRLESTKKQPRTETKRFYLLTGLITCGICGNSYSGYGGYATI